MLLTASVSRVDARGGAEWMAEYLPTIVNTPLGSLPDHIGACRRTNHWSCAANGVRSGARKRVERALEARPDLGGERTERVIARHGKRGHGIQRRHNATARLVGRVDNHVAGQ